MFKEEMYSHPSFSVLSYKQHFVLKCGVSEDRMSIVLISPMQDYDFNIVYGEVHEIVDAPSWRSATLSLRSSDELGAQLFFENFDDRFTYEALDGQIVDGRNLVMDNIFHYRDGAFLMSISHLK